MKNITLAIDDDLLARARKRAAEKGTTVNAVVRESLTRFVGQDDAQTRARRELLDMAEARDRTFRDGETGYVWNREDAYAGRRFSRYEHPGVRGDADRPCAAESSDRSDFDHER